MATVKITDQQSYRNMVNLINLGFAPDSVAYRDGAIHTAADTFELSDKNGGAEQTHDDGVFHRFNLLDPKKHASAAAQTWESLLSDVLDNFYKRHSFLIYDPIRQTANTAFHENVIRRSLSILVDSAAFTPETVPDRENTEDYVYEIAVKFKMHLGGEPKPVINRFYLFKNKETGELTPPDPERCQSIYHQVSRQRMPSDTSAAPENAARNEKNSRFRINLEETSKINDAIKAIMTNPNRGFSDYLVGEAKEIYDSADPDSKPNSENDADAGNVYCDGAQIRYVAFLRLPSYRYTVLDENGLPLLRFRFDINDDVTAVCAGCGETLISENRLRTADGFSAPIDLNALTAYDGTADEYLDTLFGAPQNGRFHHYSRLQCGGSEPTRKTATGRSCRRLMCLSKTFTCPECGEKFCSVCPYTEVVVQSADGKPMHTPCQAFCFDTLTYLPKNKTKVCRICHQRYSGNNVQNGHCSFCASVMHPTSETQKTLMRKIYKRHRYMLPYGSRYSLNLCAENAQLILFRINVKSGAGRYVAFKKTNESGALQAIKIKGEKSE